MAMEYINYIKAKAHISTATKSEAPVLSDEDEAFLQRITSEEAAPPPLPQRPVTGANTDVDVTTLPVAGESKGNDAQLALMDGAQYITLPETPAEEDKVKLGEADVVPLPPATEVEELKEVKSEEKQEENTDKKGKEKKDKKEKGKGKAKENEDEPTTKAKSRWSWLRRNSSRAKNPKEEVTAVDVSKLSEDVQPADAKPNENEVVDKEEAEEEEEDMTVILERLNLAAVNNRVFSISDETQELLKKFNLVFKDLVNGVPTAYDDLESLLTNGDKQLQKTFNNLPGFLQKLIRQLPEKMTKGLAPEMLAVAAERAEKTGINMENAGKAAGAAKKMGFKAPSLKDMVGKPGAVAGMLRSIITFLRARFPAFMGMNVLWSLAMFVLLFVFWYCYKRGREVRLEKERDLTEQEVRQLEAEYAAMNLAGQTTTTAPEGASMEEVQDGIREAQAVKEAAAVARAAAVGQDVTPSDSAAAGATTAGPSTLGTTVQPAEQTGTTTNDTTKSTDT